MCIRDRTYRATLQITATELQTATPLLTLPGQEMAELLGLTPGSVTPFGALNDKEHRVTLLLDEDYRGKLIGVHPNDNTCLLYTSRCV